MKRVVNKQLFKLHQKCLTMSVSSNSSTSSSSSSSSLSLNRKTKVQSDSVIKKSRFIESLASAGGGVNTSQIKEEMRSLLKVALLPTSSEDLRRLNRERAALLRVKLESQTTKATSSFLSTPSSLTRTTSLPKSTFSLHQNHDQVMFLYLGNLPYVMKRDQIEDMLTKNLEETKLSADSIVSIRIPPNGKYAHVTWRNASMLNEAIEMLGEVIKVKLALGTYTTIEVKRKVVTEDTKLLLWKVPTYLSEESIKHAIESKMGNQQQVDRVVLIYNTTENPPVRKPLCFVYFADVHSAERGIEALKDGIMLTQSSKIKSYAQRAFTPSDYRNRIALKNLNPDTTKQSLRSLLVSALGSAVISRVHIAIDKSTSRCKGYGHIDCHDSDAVSKTLLLLQNNKIEAYSYFA